MRALITGSSGHLGEAIARTLTDLNADYIGVDIKEGPYTTRTGSITDQGFVHEMMAQIDVVYHTATLHKPHIVTHSRQDFIDTNITGTQTLLEAACAAGVRAFVFTSTTSTFGDAMISGHGEPAVWVTEELTPIPKNIYGITKLAAENLCALAYRKDQLPCIVLRTSRFFPEDDDSKAARDAFANDNLKVNELLYRRADIADMVSAHLIAAERAPEIGFDHFIISATSPFSKADAATLPVDAPSIIARYTQYRDVYDRRGWLAPAGIERVYCNARARRILGWNPEYTFEKAIAALNDGNMPFSALSQAVGKKSYHEQSFEDGPFPVEN